MTARMRRLASDFEQIKKDFAGHKNIIVTPVGDDIPEKYNVIYFVNGIYLLPDGRIETLGRHEVEITLHADYPRYKPICKIKTPIWHPNFRDGQICIGDIWGAGESLTDIIINIGDMIQYKSWNSYSPLSADAAQWAMDNKHLFPVGNVNLYIADYASAKDTVAIDLFSDDGNIIEDSSQDEYSSAYAPTPAPVESTFSAPTFENDFEITAEELAGIEFVPTAERMQNVSHGGTVKGGRINFKTILVKGILWALIGSLIGFLFGEVTDGLTDVKVISFLCGYTELSEYYRESDKADKEFEKAYKIFEKYCKKNKIDPEEEGAFIAWYIDGASDKALEHLEQYDVHDAAAEEAFYNSYVDEFDSDEDKFDFMTTLFGILSTAFWASFIAVFIGLALGIGEGVFYGSFLKALLYAFIGAVVSCIMGFFSGMIAQWMYGGVTDFLDEFLMLEEMEPFIADIIDTVVGSIIRGIGWSIMGLGIGVAVGLIKPAFKRFFFCAIGGCIGGFIGGFLFDYICLVIPNDFVARGLAIIIMGLLIGLGVGLLEQFAKQAWLKVIRGEFEGKEYLLFAGTTSIGNNAKNTIVLFKDKLIGPHHCDIKLEGNKYVLTDCGTPMGTVVNGNKTKRHILRKGDAIAIGNSVLVFNTK